MTNMSKNSARAAAALALALSCPAAAIAGGSSTPGVSTATTALSASPSTSFSSAAYSFAASPSTLSAIRSAPGAVATTFNGQPATQLDFSKGGVAYSLVASEDGNVTVFKR